MAYQRFKLQDCLATVATPATLQDRRAQTVATVATVAGPTGEKRGQRPQSVADVASDSAATGWSVPSEISADIAIALERAAAGLRSRGCPAQDAHFRARALVRADLRNSPTLFIRQEDLNRCHVCGERESPDLPFIAVLSAVQDQPHWMHVACHAEHVRRLDARVGAMLPDVDLSSLQRRAGPPRYTAP